MGYPATRAPQAPQPAPRDWSNRYKVRNSLLASQLISGSLTSTHMAFCGEETLSGLGPLVPVTATDACIEEQASGSPEAAEIEVKELWAET